MVGRVASQRGLGAGVLVAGVVLGVAGRASDYMPDPVVLMFTLGVPWLVVSFAAGASARDLAAGAVAGAAVLVVSVLAYYAVMYVIEERSGPRYAAAMGVLWGFFGALALAALVADAAIRLFARRHGWGG